MTRRRFVTAPKPPDDAERFMRAAVGRPYVEPTDEPPPAVEPHQPPHGVRTELVIVPTIDDALRAAVERSRGEGGWHELG